MGNGVTDVAVSTQLEAAVEVRLMRRVLATSHCTYCDRPSSLDRLAPTFGGTSPASRPTSDNTTLARPSIHSHCLHIRVIEYGTDGGLPHRMYVACQSQ